MAITPPERAFHLVSIRFSHFVEKVRWTLDSLQIPYRETPLMPFSHLAYTPRIIGLKGWSDGHSSRFSTPILETDRGEVLIKSSRIMDYLSRRFCDAESQLYPHDEVRQLDEHYNQFLGPHTRRLIYYHMVKRPEVMKALADRNVPPLQALAFKVLFSVLRPYLLHSGDFARARIDKDISYIYKEFSAVEARLKDGRPYLCGDRLTAADISFACLGGAICLPQPHEGYAGQLPDYECQCEELIRISKDLRASFVGQWVLKLFKEKRGQRLIPCYPLIGQGA